MKLVSWNNGGLSCFGEGWHRRVVSDYELRDAIKAAIDDLHEQKLGPSWSPMVNIYDVKCIETIDILAAKGS